MSRSERNYGRVGQPGRLFVAFAVALLIAVTWLGICVTYGPDRIQRQRHAFAETPVEKLFEFNRRKTTDMITAADASRQYPISEAVSIAGAADRRGDEVEGLSPVEADFAPEFQSFVKVGKGNLLTLNDEPFFITGFNNYYVLSRAGYIGEGRREVWSVLQMAERLGLNVLRCWAFLDGDEWSALQPEAGIIDEKIFSEGLDFVVTEARRFGIRLILTLTNGKDDYGGMRQYVEWTNGTSISEFYTDKRIRRLFKDYVYTILHRKNTIDGVMYKDNPTILGWDIANEPTDPGHPGSVALQKWVVSMSRFIKKYDPNHLVMVGWEGFFGPSTPDRLKYNAYTHNFSPLSRSVYKNDDSCFGADFYWNHLPETIDLCVAHLYPDAWVACDQECMLEFSRDWIRQHLEIAALLKRPFLLGEYGKQKPVAHRNEFYKMVHDELFSAADSGFPVAGSLMWMLSDGEYPDYDGFTVYDTLTATNLSRPDPTLVADEPPIDAEMWNHQQLLQCFNQNAEQSVTEEGFLWNDGWNETLDLMLDYVKDMQELAASKTPPQ